MKEEMHSRINDILAKERGKMVSFARKKLNDEPHRDAEDVVQDVILRIFELADVNIPLEKLTSYIYAAIRNRIIDLMRSRRPQLSLDELGVQEELSLVNMLRDEMGIEDELENGEFRGVLYGAINSLAEEEKAVILANEFEDISFKELSEQWNVPIGTLLSRKARALEKIKQILIKGGVEI